MAEEQFTLVMILKEVILGYEHKLEELKRMNVSPLENYKEEIEKVRSDVLNIMDVDLRSIDDILAELSVPEEDKKQIANYLRTIQTLLRFNRDKKTTYIIQESQLQYVRDFFERLDALSKEKKAQDIESMNMIGRLSNLCEKYKELLRALEDKNSTTFMNDQELIELLMRECSLTESTKRGIILSIMKYNKHVFQNRLGDQKGEEKSSELDEKQVSEIFKRYHYDFSELSEDLRKELLRQGNIKNIEDILEVLTQYHFPRFSLEKKGNKLVLLLLRGNKDVLENIVLFSKKRGITPRELTGILPVLIPQGFSSRKILEGDSVLPAISGRSDDYVKNVEYLEEIGFETSYIYGKCKEVLAMNHQRLVKNMEAYQEYGFPFFRDNGTLVHPALGCLMSRNFAEIVDQFIEICPLGHSYIKQNMSRIYNIVSPKDLVFYNIIASYLPVDENGDYQEATGPFVNSNSSKPLLRGEITRYIGSGYESIPYKGIEQANKEEITGSIEIPIQEKERMDAAVEKSNTEETEIIDIVGKDLDELEPYTDPNDPNRYNFNGRLISKPKVKRIYNILKTYGLESLEDSLLYAITYNSIMNQEDFDKIKGILKGRLDLCSSY